MHTVAGKPTRLIVVKRAYSYSCPTHTLQVLMVQRRSRTIGRSGGNKYTLLELTSRFNVVMFSAPVGRRVLPYLPCYLLWIWKHMQMRMMALNLHTKSLTSSHSTLVTSYFFVYKWKNHEYTHKSCTSPCLPYSCSH